jgi:putative PIN family toxin of toxin-antitoxin system
MRVVADSNIFISTLQFGGKPAKFIRAAEEERLRLLASEPILLEIADVLSRKFNRSGDEIAASLAHIRSIADMVVPQFAIAACVDPDDDRILEAAVEGRADAIVTGDKHLLSMKSFRKIEICTVRDFLSALDRPGPSP